MTDTEMTVYILVGAAFGFVLGYYIAFLRGYNKAANKRKQEDEDPKRGFVNMPKGDYKVENEYGIYYFHDGKCQSAVAKPITPNP